MHIDVNVYIHINYIKDCFFPIPSGAEEHVHKAGTYRSCQAPGSRTKAGSMV